LQQAIAIGFLIFLLLKLHEQLQQEVVSLLAALMIVIILIPSLPNLLNPLEISRRRAWHDGAFTYNPVLPLIPPLPEADVTKYSQVHFNGTLQVKGIAYDALSTANKPNLTIVDGVKTDAHDFSEKFQTGLEAMLTLVLSQPDRQINLSGFSRGGYAAMLAAYTLHKLTGIRPLLLVGDPVIGHTPAMPRDGLHKLLTDALHNVRSKAQGNTQEGLEELEWLKIDSAQLLLAKGVGDNFQQCTDGLSRAMLHPHSCAYLACGEVRRMMDPYIPTDLSACGVLFSGFHTTFVDPKSENPFVTELRSSAFGRWLCNLPVLKDAVDMDAALARRDTVFPAIQHDAERRRQLAVASPTEDSVGASVDASVGTSLGGIQQAPETGPEQQHFHDPVQLGRSKLLQIDGTSRIVSSAGRADDWLLSVGFDVPSLCHRLLEHFNNLNASELTAGRLEVINRILVARTTTQLHIAGVGGSAGGELLV
jgi:hypothetical protein